MKLAHVIPITKSFGKETLTYFTAKDIEPGWIVAVPIRKKIVNALVVATEDASVSKSDLRSKDYALKKVESVKAKNFFLPEFIHSIEKTAEYFAGGVGAVINALTPSAVYDFTPALSSKKQIQKNTKLSENTKQEVLLLQASDEERFSTYKNIIREEFAKHSSVFFCIPEISEVEKAVKILQKGIEEHVFVFHSKMSKKQIIENWKNVVSHKHPVFIIATGQYLSIPRDDIDMIIVEKEHSDSYKILTQPFVDIRTFAKIFAKESGKGLIFGDIFLRPETIQKRDNSEYAELSTLKFRSTSPAQSFIIDMKPEKEDADTTPKSAFTVVSSELKELIKALPKHNERIFILTTRKGLSPLTVCSDCGTVVTCPECSSPLVLHKELQAGKSTRAYACHKCSHKQEAIDHCGFCGGWRLQTLGIGIEQAEDEILKENPDTKIFRIDGDSTKTAKKIMAVRDEFYKTTGAVLLGTEMALPYLDKEIANVAVLSVDSLLTIPDFSMNEKVFNLLLRLHAKADQRFLIQTRDAKNEMFIRAAKGNLMDFYKEEISQREILKYPPFSILIKISREGTQSAVEKDMEKLSQILTEYNPNKYPAFIDTIKSKYRMNILLKIKSENWPNKKLIDLLRALPQTFSVNVEPRDVL